MISVFRGHLSSPTGLFSKTHPPMLALALVLALLTALFAADANSAQR